MSVSTVGPTWGETVSRKALQALIIFFILLALYLSFRFEWKMAATAIVAVIHDIIVSVGVYALFQFEVTPATVTAFLTILGFSLYDTVVVYDKIRENQKTLTSTGKATYPEMVNRSLNAVLMRSLSTTIVALLPVLSLLIVGSLILGATALEEFALALAVGLAIGSYSSIFVAAPLLAHWKARGAAVPRAQRTPEAHVARRRVGVDGSPGRRGPGRRRGTAGPCRRRRRPGSGRGRAHHDGAHRRAPSAPTASPQAEVAPEKRPPHAPRRYPVRMDSALLKEHVRDVPDHPKPGIIFKDITPLLAHPEAFAGSIEALAAPFGDRQIDKVVGIEARGFVFAAPIAYERRAGFVPVRKAGKLPWEIEREEYELEYGTDLLEIHRDAIAPGEQVLIVDDVLATGGTASAVVRLVERLGGSVVGLTFLIELAFLDGRKKLEGQNVHTVICYA